MALFDFSERRSGDPNDDRFWSGFTFSASSHAGPPLQMHQSLGVSAVYTCANAISDDISTLPLRVIRKIPNMGKIEVLGNLSYLLKQRPSSRWSSTLWKKQRMMDWLTEGNSVGYIARSRSGEAKELRRIHPLNAQVSDKWGGVFEERTFERQDLFYKVHDGWMYRVVPEKDIIHSRGWSLQSPVWGDSVIRQYVKEQVGLLYEMGRFEGNFFKNGMNPGGTIEFPAGVSLGKNEAKFREALERKFGGNFKSKVPMTLENGAIFRAFEAKMADQQFVELLRMSQTDVFGIFGVPLSRGSVSESNTNYNNSEQETIRYYGSALLPRTSIDEQELTHKLLTPAETKRGLRIRYNMSAALQSDTKARMMKFEKLWRMGFPLNRILELEDMNPVQGGDIGRVQVNTGPVIPVETLEEDEENGKERA